MRLSQISHLHCLLFPLSHWPEVVKRLNPVERSPDWAGHSSGCLCQLWVTSMETCTTVMSLKKKGKWQGEVACFLSVCLSVCLSLSLSLFFFFFFFFFFQIVKLPCFKQLMTLTRRKKKQKKDVQHAPIPWRTHLFLLKCELNQLRFISLKKMHILSSKAHCGVWQQNKKIKRRKVLYGRSWRERCSSLMPFEYFHSMAFFSGWFSTML